MVSLQLLSVLLVVSTAGLQAPAASPTFASTIDQWWGMIETSFVSAAEAMPADKYDFAPTGGSFEGVRTSGARVK